MAQFSIPNSHPSRPAYFCRLLGWELGIENWAIGQICMGTGSDSGPSSMLLSKLGFAMCVRATPSLAKEGSGPRTSRNLIWTDVPSRRRQNSLVCA